MIRPLIFFQLKSTAVDLARRFGPAGASAAAVAEAAASSFICASGAQSDVDRNSLVSAAADLALTSCITSDSSDDPETGIEEGREEVEADKKVTSAEIRGSDSDISSGVRTALLSDQLFYRHHTARSFRRSFPSQAPPENLRRLAVLLGPEIKGGSAGQVIPVGVGGGGALNAWEFRRLLRLYNAPAAEVVALGMVLFFMMHAFLCTVGLPIVQL